MNLVAMKSQTRAFYDPKIRTSFEGKKKLVRKKNVISFVLALGTFLFLCQAYMSNGLPLTQIILGIIIICFSAIPFIRWLKRQEIRSQIPLFEVTFFSNALLFGFAVFQGTGSFRGKFIPAHTVTYTLLLVLLGMGCMLVGWLVAKRWRASLPFNYVLDEKRLINLMTIYLVLYALFSLSHSTAFYGLLRATVGNLFDFLIGASGVVAIFGLSGYETRGKLTKKQRRCFWLTIATICLHGVASGWLTSVLSPVLAMIFGRLINGGQINKRLVIALIVGLVFLEAGKGAFRHETWQQEMGGRAYQNFYDVLLGLPSRVSLWIDASTQVWENEADISGSTRKAVRVFKRLDGLDWFTWVVYETPAQIPYMKGYSYYNIYLYMIPRFLYHNKPINLQKANTIALRYGWITGQQVGKQAVTMSLMDEAYINYGPLGVVIGMFIFGIFLRMFVNTLDNPRAGLGWRLPVIYLLCNHWSLQYTAVVYFGGLLQPIIALLIMYSPARKKVSSRWTSLPVSPA